MVERLPALVLKMQTSHNIPRMYQKHVPKLSIVFCLIPVVTFRYWILIRLNLYISMAICILTSIASSQLQSCKQHSTVKRNLYMKSRQSGRLQYNNQYNTIIVTATQVVVGLHPSHDYQL